MPAAPQGHETSLREYALALVAGTDAAEAFANGCKGEGLPFFCSVYAYATPLLKYVYSDVPERTPGLRVPPGREAWVASFFGEQRSWEHASTTGLAARYYFWLTTLQSWERGVLELLLYASLPGEREAPFSVDAYTDAVREITVPATRALAILRMRELPDGVAGCFELPTPPVGKRQFLFFGLRSVR